MKHCECLAFVQTLHCRIESLWTQRHSSEPERMQDDPSERIEAQSTLNEQQCDQCRTMGIGFGESSSFRVGAECRSMLLFAVFSMTFDLS